MGSSRVSLLAKKLLGIGAGVAVLGVLIGFYVAAWATSGPPTIAAVSTPPLAGVSTAQLTLQTVAAVGPAYSSHPDWVSYLVLQRGKWVHSTVFKVPANSLVHVTVYEYDTQTGLRNPFLAQVQGTVGGTIAVDGKTVNAIKPEEASHTFAVPQLGLFVPLPGIEEEAPNQCAFAPCSTASAHRTITFTFRTGGKGRYRWQCFVPCAAGWIAGNGGPMQTLGYMDGFLEVA
jgi:hypothetical protein